VTRLAAAFLALTALTACRRDSVRGLDATPEVPPTIEFGVLAVNDEKVIPLTIKNTGQIGLQVADTQVDEPFNVEDSPDPVAAGQSGDVLVKFQPVAPGEMNGTLTLSTSSVELPVVTVRLHGIAYTPQLETDPNRLDFGDVNIGEQKVLTFTVTNRAPVDLNPTVQPLEGGASPYIVAPQGSLGRLAPGGQATVSVAFAPTAPGERNSSVLLSCSVCATRQVQVTGNGIGTAPPPPPPPADAGTPDAGPPDLDAGDADAGPPPDNDAGTPDVDAGPPPVETCTLQAKPDQVDFPAVAPGATVRQVVTLSSVGNSACFVQTPYLAPGTDPSFSATPLAATTLQPSQSTSVTVIYAPQANTPLEVSGSLVFISNDQSQQILAVPLTGSLNPPPPPPPPPDPGVLVWAPHALSFEAQVPNAPPSQTLSLHNDGGSNFSWTAKSDDPRMTLSVRSGTLAPGADATIDVSVAAQTVAGTRSQSIVISAGTAGNAVVPVSIVFTAAPPPPPPPAALEVNPLALKFVAQLPKTPASQSITVSNVGGQPLSWTGSVDDAAVSFKAASGSLAPGAGQLVTVSVAAAAFAGTRTASLVIDAGAAGSKTVLITIEFDAPPPPPPPPQYGGSAWPKFHHDNTATGLSHIDTSGNTGTLLWKHFISAPRPCINDPRTDHNTRCGTYVNSPVLAENGTVYELGGDGYFFALDRASGKQLWKVKTGVPWIAANEGTPTVTKDGSIFLMTAGESKSTSQFYKISKSGTILWQNTPDGTGDGFDSSPALGDDGTLYLADDDSPSIVAHDQRGVTLSRVAIDPPTDIETQSGALAPDNIGYWSANGNLFALTTSKQLWSYTDPKAASQAYGFHNIKSAPSVTGDGKVIFTFVFETTVKGVVEQSTRITAFAAGRAKKLLWSATLGPTRPQAGLSPGAGLPPDDADSMHYRSGITSPAIGPDGTIYVGHADGLFALNPQTGKVKWGVGMAAVVSSPAVGADGTVYVGSADGALRAIAPDGKEQWRVNTGGQLNSSPAIGADGTVYVMSDDGSLYAVK
jgi:outer membrane protein assembly factor BamB